MRSARRFVIITATVWMSFKQGVELCGYGSWGTLQSDGVTGYHFSPRVADNRHADDIALVIRQEQTGMPLEEGKNKWALSILSGDSGEISRLSPNGYLCHSIPHRHSR